MGQEVAAKSFSRDPALREQLIAHCRSRQALIEGQLPSTEGSRLRPRFTAELAYGQRYQQEYQDYAPQL